MTSRIDAIAAGRATERMDILDWLDAEHDRMMGMAGYVRNTDGQMRPTRDGPDVEAHNMWVGKANAVFAIRAGIRNLDHLP